MASSAPGALAPAASSYDLPIIVRHYAAIARAVGQYPDRWSEPAIGYVAALAGRIDPAFIVDLLDIVDARTADLRLASGVHAIASDVLQ